MTPTLQQQIADLTAQHAAALAALTARLVHEHELRALCPDGFEPGSFGRRGYNDLDTIHVEVSSAAEVRALVSAWHEKYGAFLPVGEYRKGCTVVTAYPWDEYATVEPEKLSADGIEVRNHAGKGFNSLSFAFYPNIPGKRVCVEVSEAFRAGIAGFHGHVSANYNLCGDPVYASIHKVAPAAFKGAAFTLRYGSGSDDAANFCAVFSFDQLLAALPVFV